ESVDPDAKIIFGPIHDERLKKGEIKVTVIATGFTPQKKSPASATTRPNEQRQTPEKREIHNSLPQESRKSIEQVIEVVSDDDDDDDDFSLAIPAFLRKGKK